MAPLTAKIKPVKLVSSVFSGDLSLLGETLELLRREFGPFDYESQELAFDHTAYYAAEMGGSLKRKIISFAGLVAPEKLPEIKLFTNGLEKLKSSSGKRRINIDPGYLSEAKFVLATTKNYSHRLYLGQGIFAEVTLTFRGGSFRALPWTYPDYASAAYLEIFKRIRTLYLARLKEEGWSSREREP